MINATDLKNGATFLYYGKPYKVIKYSLIKMGRGGATVKVTTKNLENGANEEKTFSSNLSFEEATTTKRKLQYLYSDGKRAIFMDTVTFDQIEISDEVLEEDLKYIKEGDLVDILFWNEKPLSIELPPNVAFTVFQTDPGVKGNSATNIFKTAVLENGLTIKVPLFIRIGEKIRVDTRSGEYIERAK